MPRLTTDAWLEVRAKREAGLTFPVLAAEYGVDKVAVCRRAKREEWADGDGLAGVIRQKVNAKVNRIDTANKVTRLATIDAADRAAEIMGRSPRRLAAALRAVSDRGYCSGCQFSAAGQACHRNALHQTERRTRRLGPGGRAQDRNQGSGCWRL